VGIILIRAISWFSQILITLLCVRALISWFAQNPYSRAAHYYSILVKITEPFVAPCRKLLSHFNTGMFDFSVLLAFFFIMLITKVLNMIVYTIFY